MPSPLAHTWLSATLVAALCAAGCTYDYDAPFRCSNGAQDGDETDVDCGGGCEPCGLARACAQDAECAVGTCREGRCGYAPVPYWEPLPSGPPARWGAAFSPVGDGTLVLFGGLNDSASGAPRFGDTWVYDGEQWVERTSGASPAAQAYGAMVEDRALKRAVLLGSNGETWSHGADGWKKEGSGGPKLYGMAMGYDDIGKTALVFGGVSDGGAVTTDLFARASAEGAPWTEPPDGGTPGAGRWGMAFGFDRARRRLVVFGGQSDSGPLAVTAQYDPAKQVWATSKSPVPARYAAASTYDEEREVLVVFTGRAGPSGEGLQDLWEYGADGWHEIHPRGKGPGSALFFASMAHDAARHRVLLYGGASVYSKGGGKDAVFSYSMLATSCASNEDCGTRNCVDGVCCASSSCAAGSACNLPKDPGFCVSP